MKIISVLSLSLAVLCLGCADNSLESQIAQAQEAFNNRRYAEAFVRYESLAKETGLTADICYNLALCSLYEKDYTSARDFVAKMIDAQGATPTSTELLALIDLNNGAPSQALKRLKTLILAEKSPAKCALLFTRAATVCAEMGNYSAAHALLLHAQEAAPMEPLVRYNLGVLYMDHLEQYTHAADHFAVVKRLVDQNTPLYLRTQKHITKLNAVIARNTPPAANQIDAATAASALERAKKALSAHKWSTAENAYRLAHRADPTNFIAINTLAKIYVIQGKEADALSAYQKAIKINPNKTESAYKAAEIALRLRQFVLAEKILTSAIATMPDSPLQIELMVRIHSAQQHFAEARIWAEYYLSLLKTPSPAKDAYAKWARSLPEL